MSKIQRALLGIALSSLLCACADDLVAPTVPAETATAPAWLMQSAPEGDCESEFYTPNGSLVTLDYELPNDVPTSLIQEWKAMCGDRCQEQAPADKTYSCHSYAFMNNGVLGGLCKNRRWLNSANMMIFLPKTFTRPDGVVVDNPIGDGSYVVTDSLDACATLVNTGEHTGRILKDSNGRRIYHSTRRELGERIVSKWGGGPLMEHYREDGPFKSMDGYPQYYKPASSTCGSTPPPPPPPPPAALSVTISGPVELAAGQRGTWNANPKGGTGTYSCAWDVQTAAHGWIRVSSQMSYSTVMHASDRYIRLRASCSSNASTASGSYSVTCTDCDAGGGPM